jgi:hypothetical protein
MPMLIVLGEKSFLGFVLSLFLFLKKNLNYEKKNRSRKLENEHESYSE